MYIHKIFVLIAVIHTTCLLKLEAGCYPLFWSPFSQHSWVHTSHCQTYTLCPLFQGRNVSSGRPGHLAPVRVILQLCVSCLAVTTPCWGACYSCQVDWLQGLPLDVPYSHELVWWVGLLAEDGYLLQVCFACLVLVLLGWPSVREASALSGTLPCSAAGCVP